MSERIGPRDRAVVRRRRRDEGAVVRLDRLVGDDAREDQLAAAARAPVVRLRLADRDLDVALRDLVVQPDRRAPRGDADVAVGVGVARVVLEERDPHPLHAREVLTADLHLRVGLGHREDLAVRADHGGVGRSRGLERIEDGGEQPRLRRGTELVVDHDRDGLPARDQLGEPRPGDRLLERRRSGSGRVGQVRRLRAGRSPRAGWPAGSRARAPRGTPSSRRPPLRS